jgi:hypothetical protein
LIAKFIAKRVAASAQSRAASNCEFVRITQAAVQAGTTALGHTL